LTPQGIDTLVTDLKKKDWSTLVRRSLSATAIVANLAKLDNWKLTGEDQSLAIEKTFNFGNYFETIAFVNALAFIAHKQDHHPDLTVHYSGCIVRFNTHDVGGLSPTDFECAALIDGLIA
jgi:4a-hydroxytetrahydrobiopterin dehydratase